jgi:3-phenylpropionate/trans-cinnamate dioxygenase ferredoxin reductase component
MSAQQTFVIVGASLAGAKAAETLRDEGFDGRVVLVGEESERPYERPELSKGYLLGKKPAEKLYVHEADFYKAHDIELRTSRKVTAIDRESRVLTLDNGELLDYDRLLLTTGAWPRRFPAKGADLPGVAYLRTLEESTALQSAIKAAARVVVVGAGWIGCEVAACARMLGAEVSMVAPDEYPLQRVLGQEVGKVYRDLHAEKGVDLHLSIGVDAIEGTGKVEGVRLSDGTLVEGDLVVVGIGATPRDELAREAGLDLDNGVVVDEFLQTSSPEIFAAGDVASAWHPFYEDRIRVEHWANALNQGPAAARNMLGQHKPYVTTPYFYSDQYDFGMEYHGYATTWDRVIFRGDPASREFLAFWVKDGRVRAGMNANIWDVSDPLKAVVRSGLVVDLDRLADPSVPLEELLG